MNLTACFAGFVYKLVYIPISEVLRGAGMIFDKILMLSIEGNLVAPKDIIDSTWMVVRDFSNMLFIFILLYTGIMTMFGASDWRKVVLNVVIIALLINFSLFFTKVVIDAGNVLAVGILSAIKTSSVSAGLVGSFAPQRFLSTASDTLMKDTSGGKAIIVFIISSVVSGFAAYVFFKAALLFIGRLIAFWGLMIISPFAFISMVMPKGNIFNKWLDTLISQAFVAPVFLFFIYIIMKVISAGNGIMSYFSTRSDADWFESLLGPVIVATLLIIALQKALEIATDMSGDFGKMGSDMASKAIGMTAMVATGGTAALARGAIGGMAAGALKRGGEEFAESKMGDVAKWATRASFDVRNAPIPKFASKGLGSLGVEIGKSGGVGGYEKIATERRKKMQDNVPKASIFTEQGIRERAEREKKGEEEVKKTEEALEASTKAVQQLETTIKQVQELSKEAMAVKSMEAEYLAAQQRAERDRGTVNESASLMEMTATKDALEKAIAEQATAMKPMTEALKKAKDEEKNAKEAVKNANRSAEAIAKEDISALNETLKQNYANKVESGGGQFLGPAAGITGLVAGGMVAGPVGAVAGYTAGIGAVSAYAGGDRISADKIRKGEESAPAKKLKELTAKKKKAEEEGKSADYIAAIEDQIKETKGDVKKEEEMKK